MPRSISRAALRKAGVTLVPVVNTTSGRVVVGLTSLGISTAKRDPRSEHAIQSALFALIDKDPRLAGLPIYAVPNFPGHVGRASARIRAGARAKAEGRRKGVPDLNVDVARGGLHGLRIEMKSAKGSVGPEQREWHQRLTAQGYGVFVFRDEHAAYACILGYLGFGGLP